MSTQNTCRFCNLVDGKYQHIGIDQPFMDSDDYVAVASIGALIEGWSLIIPKEHKLSMRSHYDKYNFTKFLNLVVSRLSFSYESLIAFEHGSNKEGSITSCGTDHAHIHIVPFQDSLISDMHSSNMKWESISSSDINSKVQEKEYLFYTELGKANQWGDPAGYLHILEKPISQYFRHLIAARIGQPQLSDYKQFPQLETARKTRKILVESII